jgi:hypothetical protein
MAKGKKKEGITYEIIEPHESVLESLIKASGVTREFTLADTVADVERLQKMRTESEGQINYEEAKVSNIVHHHPEVLALDPKLQLAAKMYYDATKSIENHRANLALIEEGLEEYKRDLAEIEKQTGLKLMAPEPEAGNGESQISSSSEKSADQLTPPEEAKE